MFIPIDLSNYFERNTANITIFSLASKLQKWVMFELKWEGLLNYTVSFLLSGNWENYGNNVLCESGEIRYRICCKLVIEVRVDYT